MRLNRRGAVAGAGAMLAALALALSDARSLSSFINEEDDVTDVERRGGDGRSSKCWSSMETSGIVPSITAQCRGYIPTESLDGI